jgi:hypothetical protein
LPSINDFIHYSLHLGDRLLDGLVTAEKLLLRKEKQERKEISR